MTKVYLPASVDKIIEWYDDLLFDYNMPINKRLSQLANKLWEAYKNENEIAVIEISNYHPRYLGKKAEAIFTADFTLTDAQSTIAAEYGFMSWKAVEALGDEEPDPNFEHAIDALLDGKIASLQSHLEKNPELVLQRSPYGHRATLLHYVGSNGLELYRQRIPENLPEITEYLLKSGANPNAKMQVYGGEFTAYELLTSSAHPKDAGLLERMKVAFENI